MNKLEIKELPVLKYKESLVFFEDIYHLKDKRKSSAYSSSNKRMKLTESQLQKVYVNLTINIAPPGEPKDVISNKMKVDLTTTAFNLIEKMSNKLMAIKKGLVIDIKKKILKLKG